MKRSDDFLLRNVGGQDILVPLGSKVLDMNALITLNATGRSVWELLSEDRSLEYLVAEVVKEFDIDEGAARADVQAFLNQLGQLGMLKK
ncbi:MAG: PqqD family protein [Syntrophobacteraceae bacterium]